MNQIDNGTINYRDELVRKLIHLCSLSIPVIYYFISRSTAITILLILTVLAILLDLARYLSPGVGNIFYKIFIIFLILLIWSLNRLGNKYNLWMKQ